MKAVSATGPEDSKRRGARQVARAGEVVVQGPNRAKALAAREWHCCRKKVGQGLFGRAKIKVELVSLGGECHNYGLRKALTAKVLAAKVSRGLRCSCS